MQKKSVLTRLFGYMGGYKILMVICVVLAAWAAVLSLKAYVCVYGVAREVVGSAGALGQLDEGRLADLGWQAVMLIALSFCVYGLALFCSHVTAFNTVAKLRVQLINHIGRLPLGYHTTNPSGKQRKIIEKNTDNLENLIAHQIPDFVQSAVLPVAFLVFMFTYDWRLSLACLIPILIGFGILASMLKGESQGFVVQYQKSAEDISNAAVEYVRGVSVVKMFGQTAHSFKRYSAAVKEYNEYMLKYSLSMENTDSAYNTAVNGIFFALIPAGIILFNLSANPEKAVLSFIFFAVLIPVVVTILTRIMSSSSNLMISKASLDAIDKILEEQPLPEPSEPKKPARYDITLENVSFAYTTDGPKALEDISLTVQQGSVTALVGESGGGKKYGGKPDRPVLGCTVRRGEGGRRGRAADGV